MAADCGSPTNIRPFGPTPAGPAVFGPAGPCFLPVVSAAGGLPAGKASKPKAARGGKVPPAMKGSLGGMRGEIMSWAAFYHRNLDRGCKDHLRLPRSPVDSYHGRVRQL